MRDLTSQRAQSLQHYQRNRYIKNPCQTAYKQTKNSQDMLLNVNLMANRPTQHNEKQQY